MLLAAQIPYDTSRIAAADWKLRGEYLMPIEEFRRLSALIRVDVTIEDDLDARLYKIPDWFYSIFYCFNELNHIIIIIAIKKTNKQTNKLQAKD